MWWLNALTAVAEKIGMKNHKQNKYNQSDYNTVSNCKQILS